MTYLALEIGDFKNVTKCKISGRYLSKRNYDIGVLMRYY